MVRDYAGTAAIGVILKSFIKNNKENILIILFTYFIMFMAVDHFPMPRIENLSLWPMAHWGITYETGFVFRGLMGTIATELFGKLSFNAIYIIFMVFLIALGAIFALINIKIYKKNPGLVSLILILFIVSQPSCIRWWSTASLFGRVDIVLVIIAIVIGVFLTKYDKKIMLPAAFVLSVIALLTHEAFAVLFSSVVFALMLYAVNKGKKKLDLSPLFFYYIPILALFAVVTVYGKSDIPLEEFKKVIANNFTGGMKEFDFDIYDVYFASVDEKITIATGAMDKIIYARLALTFVVLLPELIFIGTIFGKYIKRTELVKNKVILIIVCGSVFAPLTSVLAGYDFLRWVGHFIICVIIAFVSLYLRDEGFRETAYETIFRNKYLLLILSVINICLGEYTALVSYPLLENLLSHILAS